MLEYLVNLSKQIICIFSTLILFQGCASFKSPLYPEIIYNNRQPLISVTYEYGEIELILPLAYETEKPENISFSVFGQGDI